MTSTNLIPIISSAGSGVEEMQATLIQLSSGTDGREMGDGEISRLGLKIPGKNPSINS